MASRSWDPIPTCAGCGMPPAMAATACCSPRSPARSSQTSSRLANPRSRLHLSPRSDLLPSMFHSCAFCNAGFDGDGGPSGLGVGRRLAFDEWKGRLWVVCPRCSRWNLTPFDDRLERIEAVARAASQGRIAASTDEVALIRWEQYSFVRVGKPPRVELATWRYGERLRNRQRERLKVVVPLTV